MSPAPIARRSALMLALLAACTTPSLDAQAVRGAARSDDPFSPATLESLVRAFAHDSMGGRAAGSEGARRAARFLAAELERMGISAAGEHGSYFQSVPLVSRSASPESRVLVGGEPLTWGTDFLPARPALRPIAPREVEVVVAGAMGHPRSTWAKAEQLAGKAALFLAPAAPTLQHRQLLPSMANRGSVVADAAAIIFVLPDPIDEAQRQMARAGLLAMSFAASPRERSGPPTIFVSEAAAERMLGKPLGDARSGDIGARVTVDVRPLEEPRETFNVVAVIPGSDAALRSQYVAIGAHLDHVGIARGAVGDSIYNGADDDASGSVAMLAIARSLASHRPRRSVLLVWHTAEELGLYGSEYFTDHPTVPRDSIVAQLNLDMIGRGAESDLTGGGPRYLQLIGARRLSTELGDIIAQVNAERARPFAFDVSVDAPDHPEQYYCRSDHYNYARYGIPVAFFSTGGHADYHRASDEPERLDYRKLADVSRLVHDIALRLADRDARPRVDRSTGADGCES